MSGNKYFQISTKAILKNDKGEVLVLLENGQSKGFYDFPGGRIQEGEEELKPSAVLAREVAEEAGPIEFELSEKPCAVGRHSYIGRNGEKVYLIWIFFEGKFLGGDVKISAEHDGYKWVDLETIELTKYFVRGSLDGMKNYLGRE